MSSINQMSFEEKKQMRLELLKELYNYNEEHAGHAWHREIDRHDEKGKNILLAYEYLAEKNYISLNKRANTLYLVKITSYGIDFVESQ